MTPDTPASSAAAHEMVCEAETPAEVLFVCPEQACGRRVVVGKSHPRLTVLTRGDFRARHVGSLGAIRIDGLKTA